MFIKGEITAAEDLTIDGQIEGKVMMPDHHLTIGVKAIVKADVVARYVTVHGMLNGSVRAGEKLEILETAQIEGEVVAPRLFVAEGAQLTGTVNTRSTEPAARVARYRMEKKPEAS